MCLLTQNSIYMLLHNNHYLLKSFLWMYKDKNYFNYLYENKIHDW